MIAVRYGLPSAACAPFVGRRLLDVELGKHGHELLSHPTFVNRKSTRTEYHDGNLERLAAGLVGAYVPCSTEVFGLFAGVCAGGGAAARDTFRGFRDRRKMVPDMKWTDLSGAECLGDVKTIANNVTNYGQARTLRADKPVDIRAAKVNDEYDKHALALDVQFNRCPAYEVDPTTGQPRKHANGTKVASTTVGPLRALLRSFGPVKGFAFGDFGEASVNVHALLKVHCYIKDTARLDDVTARVLRWRGFAAFVENVYGGAVTSDEERRSYWGQLRKAVEEPLPAAYGLNDVDERHAMTNAMGGIRAPLRNGVVYKKAVFVMAPQLRLYPSSRPDVETTLDSRELDWVLQRGNASLRFASKTIASDKRRIEDCRRAISELARSADKDGALAAALEQQVAAGDEYLRLRRAHRGGEHRGGGGIDDYRGGGDDDRDEDAEPPAPDLGDLDEPPPPPPPASNDDEVGGDDRYEAPVLSKPQKRHRRAKQRLANAALQDKVHQPPTRQPTTSPPPDDDTSLGMDFGRGAENDDDSDDEYDPVAHAVLPRSQVRNQKREKRKRKVKQHAAAARDKAATAK
ncbi:hypothetical protein M885DRAFT_624881 [Pelagophyceae sp. CCMP2097]|nr:hypothetical protein M885DRAFT_624881 [Pelagophyceae sp. CCMP2097]